MADERSIDGRRAPKKEERTISAEARPEESRIDYALRPRSLEEMIGQERLRDKMRILVEAARKRDEALDHVLLYGPPGLGKCISGKSLILTADGLVRFDHLITRLFPEGAPEPGTYQETTLQVYGRAGLEEASHIYANGTSPIRRLRSETGFEIEGTPNHPLLLGTRTGPTWSPLDTIQEGDFVAVARGTGICSPTTAAFKHTIGPFFARSLNLGRMHESEGGSRALSVTSTGSACTLRLPTEEAANLHLLLADFGIIARRHSSSLFGHQELIVDGPLDSIAKRRGPRDDDPIPYARSILTSLYQAAQRRLPHYLTDAKTEVLNRAQVESALEKLPLSSMACPEFRMIATFLDPQIFWDRVVENVPDVAETFDFVVPGTHSFVANGLYNHNTTLSHILANEMSGNLKPTAGPAIEKAGDLAAILTNLRKGDILFIDEIHRLGRAVEEILYPAMEDFVLDITVGSGPSARSIRLKLPRFTVIGATTRLALITSPLRARFGVVERFDFYGQNALVEILTRAAALLELPMDTDGAVEIARRSRGTPRVALRLLRRVRDFAQVRADGAVTREVADQALAIHEIDHLGLDELDRRVLDAIINKFSGGPVGLETMAASISEESDTIMDVVEPYLLQLGFLDRTPRGRVATRAAYEHMGVIYPESPEQGTLFQKE